MRLTGRGAILCLFAACFLSIVAAGWLSAGVLAGVTFAVGCAAIARYVKPRDLLPVSVCPPLVFFVACVCAKALTSAGTGSAVEGTLITLASSAPWLFGGTALTVLIALRRGLAGNVRELRAGLRGEAGVQRRGAASGRGGPRADRTPGWY
ncbi:MAG TPA: DUF6542 domain-containing protein [Streptosporangiaceae bacterium]|nr:DUF6542 domain-containing protein [Streptosporangiaceae bacterium]